MPRCLPSANAWFGAVLAFEHARRARRDAEGLAVPLEGLERLQRRRATRARRRCRRRAPRPSRSRFTGLARTVPPNALDMSCPPRQWPITGTSWRTALRSSSSSGSDPRQVVVRAHRAAHQRQAADSARGSRGTAVALVERNRAAKELSAARGRWQNSLALRCGRVRKIPTGFMPAFYCAFAPPRRCGAAGGSRRRADRRDRRQGGGGRRRRRRAEDGQGRADLERHQRDRGRAAAGHGRDRRQAPRADDRPAPPRARRAPPTRQSVTLAADPRGHFFTEGADQRRPGALPGRHRRHHGRAAGERRACAWASTTARASAA